MNATRQIISTLDARSKAIFDRWEPVIASIGGYTVGWVILFYFFLILQAPYFENFLELRILLAILALPLIFYRRLSPLMHKIFPSYFLFFILFAAPFFLFFTMVKNEWNQWWVMATMCCIPLIIIIVTDWIFIASIMSFAYVLAHVTVILQDGEVNYTNFDPILLIMFFFSISGTMIVTSWIGKRNDDRLTLMKSMSGSIAHEMKTPLNAITLAIDAIKTMLPEPREQDGTGGLVTIADADLTGIQDIIELEADTIRRSNKIIDTILKSLNGNEIEQDQFKRYAAGKVIRSVVETYGFDTAKDRELVHLELSHDFDFFGDRDLLSHCLFNLLSNALYYRGKPGFRIDISTRKTDDCQRIVVRDTGPGVTPDKQERIFDQFYTSGKASGNGLGLSFSRRIIEAFGGSIVCRSVPGEWTEFVIDLPEYDSARVLQIKRELLSRKQVLIVDDQPPNRILISKYLTEMNCESDQAENGKIALDMAAKKRYDLILMDIEMPVLNGDDASRQLRTGAGIEPSMALYYWQVPIVGVTGLPEAEARRRSKQSGMDGYVLKPFRKEQIRELVDNCFFREKPEKEPPAETGVSDAPILLVDDNLMTREFLKALLEPVSHRIFQAENGMMAIDMLRELPIDLVILDLEMPVMDGLETAENIRNHGMERLRNIPIISLSGHADHETVQKTRKAGIDIHLGKPVKRHELVNAISRLLSRSGNGQPDPENSPEPALSVPGLETRALPLLDESIIEGIKGLGDPELLVQMVELFTTDAGKIISKFDEALRQNDRDSALRAIHALKGASASIGASKLQAVAARMNDLLAAETIPENSGWTEMLQALLKLTIDALSADANKPVNG